MTQNQETESLEQPFMKLAPEVVSHILSFLNEIPSRMSASGVCGLWRKLVDWREVKQLQLIFGPQLHINKVPFQPSKFSTALESLLPMVKLTSLQVQLPTQPSVCGVTINQLTNQQAVSLSHITHATVSGRPDSPEFEFVCHLLELCLSLTHLSIKLNNSNFDLSLLKSALREKKLIQLDIIISHLTDKNSSEHFAQLCQVLAPDTLKSLALDIGGEDAKDHPYGFIFAEFCLALQTNAGCVSALESLAIATPRLNPGTNLQYSDQIVAFLGQVPSLVNVVLPKLHVLEFTIPDCDPADWLWFQVMLKLLPDKFKHPLHVSLSTNHCTVLDLYVDLKFTYMCAVNFSLEATVTQQGFNCTKICEGEEATFEIDLKRLPPVGRSACSCDVCLLEYGLVKQQLIDRLNGNSSNGQLRIFVCQIPHLQVDLLDEFPTLSISHVHNAGVKIKTEGKSEFKATVIEHDSLHREDLCVGCAMLPPQ